jgi:hypothetical protein
MMTRLKPISSFVLKIAMSTLLAVAALDAAANDVEHPMEKRKFSLPPSVDLLYTISAQQSGMQLHGNGDLKWSAKEGKFLIESETRSPLLGKVLDAKSEGRIDAYGLAPASFTEKRLRKEATVTSFDHASDLISFSASADTYPLKGGEQDRNSAIWQLIAVARGAQGKFKTDSELRLFVAGQHDAETWVFKVGKQENVHTPMGDFKAVRVVKAAADEKAQQVELWLAPALEWYPVRIRFSEANGDYIEQVLSSVAKSTD